MHSRTKVMKYYPWIADALPALYANPIRNATTGAMLEGEGRLFKFHTLYISEEFTHTPHLPIYRNGGTLCQ